MTDTLSARAVALSLSESQFTEKVITRAQAMGWLAYHQRPAMTQHGWRTPVQGDAGFPDLVLARDRRVLFVELKSERGRVSEAQQFWLDALGGVVWRPSDWEMVCATLDGGRV